MLRAVLALCVISIFHLTSASLGGTVNNPSTLGPTLHAVGKQYNNTHNSAVASATHISAPLDPSLHPEIYPEILYLSDNPFKGGQLIYSILVGAMHQWVSRDNEPFSSGSSNRVQPFTSIVQTIITLEFALQYKPSDVGIVYIALLRDVLKRRHWPGFVRALVRRRNEEGEGIIIGVVEIWQSPWPWSRPGRVGVPHSPVPVGRGLTQNTSQPASGTMSRLPTLPNSEVEERLWLAAYAEVILWGIKRPYDQVLSHDLVAMTYHFRSPMAPTLSMDIRITEEAVAPEETRFHWIELMNYLAVVLGDCVRAEEYRTFVDRGISYDGVWYAYVSMVDISQSNAVL